MQPRAAECDCNITVEGQNRRFQMGLMLLTVALAASVAAVEYQLSLPWRAAVVVPFFLAAVGGLQGLYKT